MTRSNIINLWFSCGDFHLSYHHFRLDDCSIALIDLRSRHKVIFPKY